MPTDDSPSERAESGYDELAERAAGGQDPAGSLWGDSHFQRYYAWPASREAVPAVEGDRVLLAGCGRGDHVGHFLDRGATVLGLDVSGRALDTARERFATARADGRVSFRRADLTDALDVDPGAFDLVFSHLVLGHVPEWRPVLAEFRRALGADGTLVATVMHPAYFREHRDVECYHDVEAFTVEVPRTDIPTYYRPAGTMLSALLDAGFRLEAFEEPEPLAAYAERDPERYAEAMRSPQVLCLRASVDARGATDDTGGTDRPGDPRE